MGRNHQDYEKDVPKPLEEEEEKKIRINRNLARFLAEQAVQRRSTTQQQRQQNLNIVKPSSVRVRQVHPNLSSSNKTSYQRVPCGFKLSSDLKLPTNNDHGNTNHETDKILSTKCSDGSSGIHFNNKNDGPCSSSSKVHAMLTRNSCLTTKDEEERQNIINNNATFQNKNTSNIGHKSKTLHNFTNKHCTMKVSKLIGQSLSFSCT